MPILCSAGGTISPVYAPYSGDQKQSCAPRCSGHDCGCFEDVEDDLACSERICAQEYNDKKSGMNPKRMSEFGIGIIPDDGLRRFLRYEIVWSGEKYDFVDISTSFGGRRGYDSRPPGAAIVRSGCKVTSAACFYPRKALKK